MSAVLRWSAMAALLRQGRMLQAISWLLAAFALAWLMLVPVFCGHVATIPVVSMLASLVAGLGQAWYGFRVGFDAALFAALAGHERGEEQGAVLDSALHELGLIARADATRDWQSRWQGARRLLRNQSVLLALQAAGLGVAFYFGARTPCWNA